ncbi:hypothetical protein [Bacillus kwashiorkori]|uniref:hypothetical protein n=1 Tax=Bacillus kwashiorkori TaxID=1522318 RepID=UPI00078462E2|nr:hypothetical protein [Bacillus kwashiorkori]
MRCLNGGLPKNEHYLRKENERLREIIGSWRRKAQDKHSRRNFCLREGFSANNNFHYKVYVVKEVPGDLPIIEVLEELKHGFLQTVKPYRFLRCDYSTKYDSWLVEVAIKLPRDINMFDY